MPIQLGSAYGKVIIDASGVKRGVDDSTKSIEGLGKSFGAASKTIATGAALITGEVVILKKVFDFGEQGAAVIQAGESWETLLDKIGAAPDLLDQLRRASRGTVDDLKLMNSTSLLLAGTQGELATQLANATPHLLEIAKAAQKLNPSLGDTTFLYDSLARGIKRGSPLILDNLGLIIRLEEANKTYADSLGISADELTAEQQKIALLNEVMRAGNVLIDQAGGNVDSATDSFARMETSTTDASNAIKALLAPALADAADGVYWLLTYTKQLDEQYDQHTADVMKAARSYEEYAAEVVRSGVLTGRITEYQAGQIYKLIFAHDDLSDVSEKEKRILGDLMVAINLVTRADFDLAHYTDKAGKAEASHRQYVDESRKAMLLAAQAADTLGTSIDDLQQMIAGAVGQEMKNFSESQADLNRQLGEMQERIAELAGEDYLTSDQKEQIGGLQKELGGVWARIRETEKELKEGELNRKEKLGATRRLEDLRDRAGELERAIRKMGGRPYLTAAQKEELNKLQEEYDETKKKIQENAAEHDKATKQILFDILSQRAAQAVANEELSQGEADQILSQIAEQWGLVDEATATAMGAATKFFDGIEEGVGLSKEQIEDLKRAMLGLPSYRTFTLDIEIIRELRERPKDIPSGNPNAGGQHGLHGFIPPGYPDDSFLVGVTSGERIDISPPGQYPGGQAMIYQGNTFNQTYLSAAAARIGQAQVTRIWRRRLNASMGG